jgi:dolichol-phosphate mannosyltransferase
MDQVLSIIIPIYNEALWLEKSLPAIFELPIEKEIIVIDDGSNDNSVEIVHKLNREYSFKFIKHQNNQGKGSALRTGIQAMTGDYFLACDADREYDPKDIIELFSIAKEKNQNNQAVTIYGSRFLNRKNFSFHYFVNKSLTLLTNILFSSRLSDMETCYKLIPKQVIDAIELKSSGFEIEPEITAQIIKKGFSIIETPISYNRRNYKEGKKIKAKDGLLAIKMLIKQKLN